MARSLTLSVFSIVAMLCVSQSIANADEYGSPELLEAAEREGRLLLYTTHDSESSMKVIAAFNKRFPSIKIEMVRSPGGLLMTRVQAEAAANRLPADVIVFSDPEHVRLTQELFADYAPPNAASYQPSDYSPNVWPYALVAWCLAYNTHLVDNPPTSWADLTTPEYAGRLGEVAILAGGSAWSRSMFQRKTFGDEYWPALAGNKPSIYPTGIPASDALVRGEIEVVPLITNNAIPRIKEGAPIDCKFPTDGVPTVPLPAGLTKTASSPNAGRLFLNWVLSDEGQSLLVQNLGMFSASETAPLPEGADPETTKAWSMDAEESSALRADWIPEWNEIFGQRQ